MMRKCSVDDCERPARHRNPAAVLVCEIGTGVTVWLPLSQIKIEAGGGALADLGETLSITMPMWLALEKRLLTRIDAAQETLF